jgi:hypothetical protein
MKECENSHVEVLIMPSVFQRITSSVYNVSLVSKTIEERHVGKENKASFISIWFFRRNKCCV